LLTLSRGAAALPTESHDPPVDDAGALFVRGTEFGKGGAWAEALAAFEQSNKLSPQVETLYDIAFCERMLLHETRAIAAYTAAIVLDRVASPSAARPAVTDAARRRLEDVERSVGTATVRVRAPDLAGVSLLVDGRPLEPHGTRDHTPRFLAGTREPGPAEPIPGASFTVLVDPGIHVFRVTRPHGADIELSRTFTTGEAATVVVDLTEGDPPRTVAAPPPPRVLAITTLSVGIAGLTLGSVFGLMAVEKRSELSHACRGPECPPDQRDNLKRLDTYSDVTTVSLGIGAVGVAVGAWLFLRKDPAAVTLSIGPRFVGIGRSF
jgi:hypothetical protein